MEKKYYTPELSEFYIGFWYEFKTPRLTEFVEAMYNEDDFNEGAFREGTEFRVKMLDSYDLKCLGWNIVYEDEGVIKASIDIPYEYEGLTLHGKWEIIFGKDRYCSIHQYLWGETCFFRGIIKNKNVLKNLMDMIDIKP